MITGGGGNDDVSVADSVPASVHVRANGNAGSDTITGGAGDDVLEAGENYDDPDDGNDTLIGNGGSDVLYADPGADQLSGGPGDDLLVSSVAVCRAPVDGWPGDDAFSGRWSAALTVELGGTERTWRVRQPRPGRLEGTRASRDPTGPTCWSATTAATASSATSAPTPSLAKGATT